MRMDRTIGRTVSLVGLLALLVGISLVAAGTVNAANVTVFTAGVNDDFAPPIELTSPSADLLALMDPYGGGDRDTYPHRQFDDVHSDRVFGHTFTDLPPCIVAATLEIRIFWGGGNDALHLERSGINDNPTSWGTYLSALFGWANFGSAETFVLDLANLPPAFGETNIIPFMNADHDLEVYLQDDSGVDYMILTVETLCRIDIKPGSDPNSINRKSKGHVPVALLSDRTFDATTTDQNTVTFAGATPLDIGQSPEDVNGDGLLDLVFHFDTQSLALPDGTIEACLIGSNEGINFKGCDSVRLVK